MKQPATNGDRVKASRLRAEMRAGTINEGNRMWLANYEREHGARKALPAPRIIDASSTEHATPTAAQTLATEEPPLEASTFIPTAVPLSPEGDPAPPPDGKPQAEVPLVDASPATEPAGDPVAAKQFATAIAFVTGLGLASLREIVTDVESMPPEVAAMLSSSELTAGAIGTVYLSAERVAIKYGFRSVPLADEAVVAAAVVGSVAAIMHNGKRKRGAKGQGGASTPAAPASVNASAVQPVTNDALGGLWS